MMPCIRELSLLLLSDHLTGCYSSAACCSTLDKPVVAAAAVYHSKLTFCVGSFQKLSFVRSRLIGHVCVEGVLHLCTQTINLHFCVQLACFSSRVSRHGAGMVIRKSRHHRPHSAPRFISSSHTLKQRDLEKKRVNEWIWNQGCTNTKLGFWSNNQCFG